MTTRTKRKMKATGGAVTVERLEVEQFVVPEPAGPIRRMLRRAVGMASAGPMEQAAMDAHLQDETYAAQIDSALAEVDEIIEGLGRDREEIERLKEETRSNISDLQRMITA
jgi:hypothetical protein